MLTRKFDNRKELQVITYQIVKSSTSVGVNYRAASRAQSGRAMYAKMKIVEAAAGETVFWLEILLELIPEHSIILNNLYKEFMEILAIVSKANKTLRSKMKG